MYLADHPKSVGGSLKFSNITITRVALVVNDPSLRYYALIFINTEYCVKSMFYVSLVFTLVLL